MRSVHWDELIFSAMAICGYGIKVGDPQEFGLLAQAMSDSAKAALDAFFDDTNQSAQIL